MTQVLAQADASSHVEIRTQGLREYKACGCLRVVPERDDDMSDVVGTITDI